MRYADNAVRLSRERWPDVYGEIGRRLFVSREYAKRLVYENGYRQIGEDPWVEYLLLGSLRDMLRENYRETVNHGPVSGLRAE